MKGTMLEKIVDAKRVRVEAAMRSSDRVELREAALRGRSARGLHRFRDALSDPSRINIIAEFKKASPSKGVINSEVDPADVARQYEVGGAAAISVLTEEDHFRGSLDDLRAVRAAVDLPILRKDFVFDEFQIYEAVAAGADAILLIAAMLENEPIEQLRALAENELGLDVLIEVHTLDELERVKSIGAKLIGVNNRDLKSFAVSLDVSRELIKYASPETIMVAESGLRTSDDLLGLRDIGFSGFLIGETLMRSGTIVSTLQELIGSRTHSAE